jgi:superkiller protein 3
LFENLIIVFNYFVLILEDLLTKHFRNRNLLGYLLLSSKEWNDTHVATRCCNVSTDGQNKEGLKSASEILGAGAVACYAVGNSNPKLSFPTCTYQCLNEPGAIQQLQKYCNFLLFI